MSGHTAIVVHGQPTPLVTRLVDTRKVRPAG
jgi:hypothetical protein